MTLNRFELNYTITSPHWFYYLGSGSDDLSYDTTQGKSYCPYRASGCTDRAYDCPYRPYGWLSKPSGQPFKPSGQPSKRSGWPSNSSSQPSKPYASPPSLQPSPPDLLAGFQASFHWAWARLAPGLAPRLALQTFWLVFHCKFCLQSKRTGFLFCRDSQK